MKIIQPWHWRKLPLAHRTGSQVFEALFLAPQRSSNPTQEKIATLLESPVTSSRCSPLTRYSICAGRPRIIEGQFQYWTPTLGTILPFLRSLLQTGQTYAKVAPEVAHLPFTGGWLGWLGYDLAWEIERLPRLKPELLPFPIAYWYEPESFAILDHHHQVLWLATTEFKQLDELQYQLEQDKELRTEGKTEPEYPPTTPIFQMSQGDYEAAVLKAQSHIQAGDIFQANLSLRFEAKTSVKSWSIYRALQQINPSPFSSYWQTPWGAMISCSPERLVHLSHRKVESRPIAGTRSRGISPSQDQELEQELITNIKERAEHIMLVDLQRNDLGRVCEWGSVTVNELLTIERYSHVMHLVSNVIGTLRQDCDAIDLIQSVFPGGTITGCPKVRCMEIIEEVEPVRRNLFYGSCGYLDCRGHLDLNILIRTLLWSLRDNTSTEATVWGQVGAGIVADSNPEREWYESLHKAQAQLNALKLATMFDN